MTFRELLISCGTGSMPNVKSTNLVKGATSKTGCVTAIKDGDGHYGCAVKFPGVEYNVWFSAIPGSDKRSHYMIELSF